MAILESAIFRVGSGAISRDRPDGARNAKDHLKISRRYAVLPAMADQKNPKKDILLWIITVVLVAIAIFWYKKP